MGNTYAPLDDHTVSSTRPKKVAYFYDGDVGNYAYTAGHPMKPHRIRVAHSLIMNYGCYQKMEIYRAKPATKFEMTQFHTDEYVDFLQKVTPDNMETYSREQNRYNVGDDCPVFDGLFEFCAISAGGSMEGAARLNRGKCDIAINWAGGLHHAKKSEASGFCYINDIVLGIIELLRFHKRVLYIDIDVHHGDGVEEAFYTTDRVMTVSFHKYGEYFPGTGELRDIGIGKGKHYAVNFPLRDGITDEAYKDIFEPVIDAVMTYYRPEAVVLQCGGDSLSGDRLGCFNVSMKGHANCVNFVQKYNLPTLILGGGGYTMRNVARTWAFETGQLIGTDMSAALPYTEYYEYFAPDYELDVRPSNMDNLNTPEYLRKIKNSVIENIRRTCAAPSVQATEVPRASLLNGLNNGANRDDDVDPEANPDIDDMDAADDDADADARPDVRRTRRSRDKAVTRDDEFEDSDDEDAPLRQRAPGSASGRATAAGASGSGSEERRRPRITDYPNPFADREDDDLNGDGKSEAPAAAAAAAAAAPPAEDEDAMDADDEAAAVATLLGAAAAEDEEKAEKAPDVEMADAPEEEKGEEKKEEEA